MAELNTLGGVIKTAYEGEADTNVFTDAEKTTVGNLGTASPLDVPASGDAAAGEVVKGDDTRLTDARAPTGHNQSAATITDFSTEVDARIEAASVGALSNVELTSPANKEVLEFDSAGNLVNVIGPNFKWVYNPSGSVIPAGTLVQITGSVAGYPIVTVADKDTDAEVSGILFDELGAAGFGNMQMTGTIQETFIDTSAVTAGDPIYLGAAGAFTTTKPTTGNVIHVGKVGIEAASDGSLLLKMPASVVSLDEIAGAGTAAASDTGDFAAAAHNQPASTITDFNASVDARITTEPVRTAGAVMDDEVTNLAAVKAFDPAAYATEQDIEVADLNAQAGTAYTLALTDRGQPVTMDNASANTVTIPANSAVDFDIYSVITVIQIGAGTTTVVGDTGVAVNGTSAGSVDVAAQWQGVSLIQLATDVWVVSGGSA